MRRVVVSLLLLLCFWALPLMAQRRGATELGGSISFRSVSNAQQRNQSELGFDPLIAFYLNPKVSLDLEPGVRFGFDPDSVSVSMLMLASLRFHLFDMIPYGYNKTQRQRMDLGISSSVFGHGGIGFWSEGYTLTQQPSTSFSGLALAVGLGTQSRFGRFSTLRVKLQYVELFPNGPVYNKRRSLIQIATGFGLFIRN